MSIFSKLPMFDYITLLKLLSNNQDRNQIVKHDPGVLFT